MDIGLKKAIDAAGNKTQLAKKLDLTKGYISRWDCIPVQWVRRVSDVTGLAPSLLHPDFADIWPPVNGAGHLPQSEGENK